ncbi:hypothetical protein BGZ59_009766 [Podila verticillata]|nr:hypothetical protein BGZ59_009766 [Podila verticillata]
MVVPHGIIRQIYGPPQRRRRFETSRLPPEESAAERTIVEQQELRLERRREVYRHKLFVKHMGANKISGFQQITPETFKIFPQLIERLVPWIRRELQAILSLSLPASSTSSSSRSGQGQHPPREDPNPTSSSELMTGLELIREYITAVLKRYDLQTDQAQDLLRDFLHEHTEHFVHELMAFARSPFSMEATTHLRHNRDMMVHPGADQSITQTEGIAEKIDLRVLAGVIEESEAGAKVQVEAGVGPEVGEIARAESNWIDRVGAGAGAGV